MSRFLHAPIVLFAIALSACVTPTTDPVRLPAGQWVLDSEHASVTWSVLHFGLSRYTGRFDTFDASLDFDPDRPGQARLTAIVQAASVSTGDTDFDQLLANSWLGAERQPQIVFVSEAVDITGQSEGRVQGTLSLNGRSRPAEMSVQFNGGLLHPLEGRHVVGFSAELTVDRTEFGIGNLPGQIVGRDVHLYIEAEFLRQGDLDD